MRYSKKTIPVWIAVLTAVLIFTWAVPVLAGKKSPEEKKAERIWSRIKPLLNKGRDLKAARLALKMAPYPETKAYAAAKAALIRKGISIEAPLMSWTSIAMIQVQNMIERDLQTTGDLKHIGTLADHTDAWGVPIRVEMVEMGEYLYMVRSAGPDKKYNTGDDPIIGGLKAKKRRFIKSGGGEGGSSESRGSAKAGGTDSTLKSLLKGNGGTVRSDDRKDDSASEEETDDPTQPQEEAIELDELIKKVE